MGLSPAAILYDSSGNAVAVINDGGVYRLSSIGKLLNASGTQINPATEDTLDAIKDTDGIKKIVDALPSGANLIGRVQIRNPGDTANLGDATNPVRNDPTGTTTQPISAASLPLPTGAATETTLSAADTKLGTIDSVLDSIKDVDGIKKITDPLPAGTNNIGDVDVVSSALPAGAATEATLSAADTKLGTIDSVLDSIKDVDGIKKITDPLPAGTNNIGDVDVVSSALPAGAATEATLSAADTKLGTIDSVLDSIKDTDGIKKITDQLPSGTNVIGKVQISDSTKEVAVVTDNSINRLEVRTSIVGQTAGTGSEKKASIIDDTEDSNVKRLQTQALLAPGSTVNIGTSIPADPANLTIEFLKETGGSEDMLVDGSTTPVEFSYTPGAGKIVAVESLLFVFTADDFEFDGLSFGPNAALTNGFPTKLTVSPSSETTLFTIKQNEDFLRIPGRVPVINNTGPKDLLSAAFVFGGLVKLDGDESDKISVYINDNMTSVKFKYLTATLYGAEV